MNKFKKNLAGNITLISVLVFSVIHLILLTLNLFNVLDFVLPKNFSFIFAYILMILCFSLFIVAFWIENLNTLKIPTWFKILFYVAFYVFTNVYYLFGLYSNIFFMIIFVSYVALLLNVCSLSIYFNVNKDEKNKLKSSTKTLIFNSAVYSIALCILAEFIISVIKIIFFATSSNTTLLAFVIEFSTMIAVCLTTTLMFAFSHRKSKKIINGCLIKIIPRNITPSVKTSN